MDYSRISFDRTVAEAIDNYEAWRRPSADNRRYLARLKEWFGSTPLRHVGQEEIDRSARELYPDGSPATWNRQIYTPIIAVMNHEGLQVRFRRPRRSKPQTRHVSKQTAELLIARADDADLAALLEFLFFTGARISEALSLTPDCVDLSNRRVRLHVRKRNVAVWRPLHDRAVHALESLPKRPDRVFRWRSRFGPENALLRLRKETGIYFTFHMARHSFATWLAEKDVGLRDIMDAGGWSTMKSVIRYVAPSEARVRRAIDRL